MSGDLRGEDTLPARSFFKKHAVKAAYGKLVGREAVFKEAVETALERFFYE